MYLEYLHLTFLAIQKLISLIGVLVILVGVLLALYQYISSLFSTAKNKQVMNLNGIRLRLGRILILGLEFIVAADLIGTTTAPDYYSVGIVAAIVAIRTVLTYTLNKEITSLSQEESAISKTSRHT